MSNDLETCQKLGTTDYRTQVKRKADKMQSQTKQPKLSQDNPKEMKDFRDEKKELRDENKGIHDEMQGYRACQMASVLMQC
eukprot:CAMPEP_0201964704 /NCGR_PEP_ID=MMETSP0904-20121228/10231_1 /ASSEMBLY_ACC=CAM_ASM_000553 /TAXON_ID=420261 /ORGANISM="Thalassiosira antarctica, Strain CCMP982" /LENGTH=80 /DNA_ID=CAMNT_0048511625 /DNA_START=181 /DNA_END=424 /DNA_ORIENTATION=-